MAEIKIALLARTGELRDLCVRDLVRELVARFPASVQSSRRLLVIARICIAGIALSAQSTTLIAYANTTLDQARDTASLASCVQRVSSGLYAMGGGIALRLPAHST